MPSFCKAKTRSSAMYRRYIAEPYVLARNPFPPRMQFKNLHGNQFCNIFLIKDIYMRALNIMCDKEDLGAFFVCIARLNLTLLSVLCSRLVVDFYLKADKRGACLPKNEHPITNAWFTLLPIRAFHASFLIYTKIQLQTL